MVYPKPVFLNPQATREMAIFRSCSRPSEFGIKGKNPFDSQFPELCTMFLLGGRNTVVRDIRTPSCNLRGSAEDLWSWLDGFCLSFS